METVTPSSTTSAGQDTGGQSRVAGWMQRLKTGYESVKPCRFALFVVLLVPVIFICVEQAREVLRCLADGPAHTAGTRMGRVLAIAGGLTCVSLAGWWCSLVLLYFKFPDTPEHPTLRARALMRWLPPVIGVIPSFGLGLACFLAASSHGGYLPSRVAVFLRGYGGVCFVYSLIFLVWFVKKQNCDFYHSLHGFRDLEARYQRVVVYALGLSTLLFLSLLIWPVAAPQVLGSTTLILLAAASWIVYGSVAIYAGHQWRLPIIRIALVGVIVFSCWNSIHDIRTLAAAPRQVVPEFEDQYRSWYSNLCARYPEEQNPPVIVVATAGGGIRAAVWTATVLGTLQDRNPAFADHVFAISGVSGGSLGAAVFDGLVKSGNDGSNRVHAQRILSSDFLSPTLAYLLFPDMVQQFLPMGVPLFGDRATALEKAWESGWRRVMGSDLFNEDFFSLWDTNAGRSVPSLFLNGTSVENGQRMVVSNVRLNGSFVMVDDVNSRLSNSIRLSTAVDMSTRFSFVSPSGRFRDRMHVVDGGYFENSGTATVSDILDAMDLADDGVSNPPVRMVLVISNDPDENRAPTPKSELLNEVFTPFHSLMSTRQARGSYSETLLRMRMEKTNFFRFSLSAAAGATNDVPLPLGWALSRRAIREMNRRLEAQNDTSLAVLNRLPH